jgi:hypothetical protein
MSLRGRGLMERYVKLSPIIPRGPSLVLTTQVSRQAGENYPTPAQIFEEIACHLAWWLTLAVLANLLLKPVGILDLTPWIVVGRRSRSFGTVVSAQSGWHSA